MSLELYEGRGSHRDVKYIKRNLCVIHFKTEISKLNYICAIPIRVRHFNQNKSNTQRVSVPTKALKLTSTVLHLDWLGSSRPLPIFQMCIFAVIHVFCPKCKRPLEQHWGGKVSTCNSIRRGGPCTGRTGSAPLYEFLASPCLDCEEPLDLTNSPPPLD